MNTIKSHIIPFQLIKGTFMVLALKSSGALCTLAINLIISNKFGASTLGTYQLILTLLIVFGILGRLGLDTYSVKFIPSSKGNPSLQTGFILRALVLSISATILLSILTNVFAYEISEWLFSSDSFILIKGLSLVLVPYVVFTLISEFFKAFEQVALFAFFRNAMLPLLVLLFLLVSISYSDIQASPVYILYTAIICVFIMTGLFFWRFLQRSGFSISEAKLLQSSRSILNAAYPMLFVSSSIFLLNYLDYYFISIFLTEAEVGRYAACVQLSMLLSFLLNATNSYISPQLSFDYIKSNYRQLKEGFWNALKLNISIAIPLFTLMAVKPSFFLGLFGEEFIQSNTTLILVSGGFLINALCGPVGTFMNMTDSQRQFMRITIIAVLTNLGLNICLIPVMGINGAAIATLISTSIWNVAGFIHLKFFKKMI